MRVDDSDTKGLNSLAVVHGGVTSPMMFKPSNFVYDLYVMGATVDLTVTLTKGYNVLVNLISNQVLASSDMPMKCFMIDHSLSQMRVLEYQSVFEDKESGNSQHFYQVTPLLMFIISS